MTDEPRRIRYGDIYRDRDGVEVRVYREVGNWVYYRRLLEAGAQTRRRLRTLFVVVFAFVRRDDR